MDKNIKRNDRNSSIESLRIMAMLFIVLSHYTVHNGVVNYDLPLGINRFLLEILTLGNIGVILFVMITGYFSINSSKVRLDKILRIIIETWVYSVIIYVIMLCIGVEKLNIKSILYNIFPITYRSYWFMSVYVILMLFSPYINLFLNSMNKRKNLYFILTMIVVFSIWPTFTKSDYLGNDIVKFVLFYSIGAYFRKYGGFWKYDKFNNIIIFSSAILIVVSVIIFDLIGTKIRNFSVHSTHFLNKESIFAIIFSMSLFYKFIKKENFVNTQINKIASSILAVYLISDNRYIREILWINICQNYKYVQSTFLILHICICVIGVFVICILIDKFRLKIDNVLFRNFDKNIDIFKNNIESKINILIKYFE